MAFAALFARAAESYTLKQSDMVSDFGGFADKKEAKNEESGRQTAGTPTVSTDSSNDLIAAFRANVDDVQQQNKDNKANVDRLRNDFREYREQSKGVFENLVDKIEQLNPEERELNSQIESKKAKEEPASGPPAKIAPKPANFSEPEDKHRVVANLLSGVNAPVDGTSYPITVDQPGRSVTKGIQFLDPNGYWENTYVPGDPTMRSLNTSLNAESGSYPRLNSSGKKLHEMAEQILQPFDAPKDAAIGVYLNADRKGIESESRMLLQVGIKGIQRASGRRAALNAALVADLRGNPSLDTKRMIRAVVMSFAEKKESSDRIRLYLLTDRGITFVQPEDFRLGYLTVEFDKLVQTQSTTPTSPAGMTAALREAVEAVATTDDPNAPLGSSTTILISSKALSPEMENLTAIARQSAIAGVPVSVIGVGAQAQKSESETLALAGQGTRREVTDVAAADKAVDGELAAAGNVVARAIRLQIKLAPGVKLVEVIGSKKLNQERAAQVKEAEENIDLRVAKSLGIDADRGNDEEGIQIVIPSFYAGDSHVILLDVVASGAGPLATVNAKFKDLVFLKNGAAQSSLTLQNSEQGAGPLELNVLKNLLALRLSTTLEQAAAALGTGKSDDAVAIMSSYERLLQASANHTIGLNRDKDIAADLTLVQNFIQAILRPELSSDRTRRFVADSMTVAGKRKVHRIQSE